MIWICGDETKVANYWDEFCTSRAIGNDEQGNERKMKRMELASTACTATVVPGCKHLARIVLCLGLSLGINGTCLSGEFLPSVLILTTDEVDEVDEHCQNLLDEVHISQITVDIRPRDLEGQLVDEEGLPDDCNGFFSIPAVYASSLRSFRSAV